MHQLSYINRALSLWKCQRWYFYDKERTLYSINAKDITWLILTMHLLVNTTLFWMPTDSNRHTHLKQGAQLCGYIVVWLANVTNYSDFQQFCLMHFVRLIMVSHSHMHINIFAHRMARAYEIQSDFKWRGANFSFLTWMRNGFLFVAFCRNWIQGGPRDSCVINTSRR